MIKSACKKPLLKKEKWTVQLVAHLVGIYTLALEMGVSVFPHPCCC